MFKTCTCGHFYVFPPSGAFEANNVFNSTARWYLKSLTVTSHQCHGVSNHQKLDCLFSSLFRLTPERNINKALHSWWHHQMETFSALLALCAGNSPVTGEFPSQRPVTRSFDVSFLIGAWTNGWVNNRDTGDLRRHRAHHDVIVMMSWPHHVFSSYSQIAKTLRLTSR